MKRFTLLPAFAIYSLLLVGCASSTPPAADTTPTHWTTVEAPALGIAFDYPGTLTAHGENEWETETGDPVYAAHIQYDHVSMGAGDWALPKDIRAQVRDNRTCSVIEGPNVYLPVNMSRPHLCDIVLLNDGSLAFYVIGIGRPHESIAFRESMILLLRDSDAILLQGISPLAPYPLDLETLLASKPDVAFGTPEFQALNTQLDQALDANISSRAPDVQEAMSTLWQVTQSIHKEE